MFSTATTPVIIKTDIDALMQKDKFGWASRLLSSFSLRSLTIHKNQNFHNLLCYGLHNTHIASQLSAFFNTFERDITVFDTDCTHSSRAASTWVRQNHLDKLQTEQISDSGAWLPLDLLCQYIRWNILSIFEYRSECAFQYIHLLQRWGQSPLFCYLNHTQHTCILRFPAATRSLLPQT